MGCPITVDSCGGFVELTSFFNGRHKYFHTGSSRCGSYNSCSRRLLIGAIICIGHVARYIALCIATGIARIVIGLGLWHA
jgi:hypothetical protein